MKAIIKTKSNFKNLNGTVQNVSEISGNRVTCLIYLEEFGKQVSVDFTKDEIEFVN